MSPVLAVGLEVGQHLLHAGDDLHAGGEVLQVPAPAQEGEGGDHGWWGKTRLIPEMTNLKYKDDDEMMKTTLVP